MQRTLDLDGPTGGQPPASEYFVYEGDELALRFDNAQKLTHRYLYGPQTDQVLADEVFSAAGASTDVYWYGLDRLGSVREIYDSANPATSRAYYDPFGVSDR